MFDFIKNNLMSIALVGLLIFGVGIDYLISSDSEARFYKYLQEDNETCVQRARRDKKDYDHCQASYNSAKLAFESKDRDFMIHYIIILVVIFAMINTQKQLDEIKREMSD
jgi:hypothetical protein